MSTDDLEYVGFWPRVGAALIDTLLVLLVCAPVLTWYYGADYWLSDAFIRGPVDFLVNWVLPGARRARNSSSADTWVTTCPRFPSAWG